MGPDADVLVVGAGPAGSATALLLARRGYRVVVVDRARFPRPKPCGEYLNPAAVAALDRMGIARSVASGGTSLSGMFLAGPDGTAAWVPFPSGRGLLIPRERLDHAVLSAAASAGALVLEEFRVDRVTPGVMPAVTGRHRGRTLRLAARLVVGADGIRSVVARHCGPLASPADVRYTVGAHFEGLQAPVPRGDLHLGGGWYAGAALYGGGFGNVVVAAPRTLFRRAGRDPAALFHALCDGLPVLRGIVRGARRLSPFVAVGPLGHVRRPAVGDGLLLVGDAAGPIDPMTGEGIALALRGAELASDAADGALRGGPASQAALAPYERARRAAFRDTWQTSRLLQWIVRRPRLAAALFRRLADDPTLIRALLGVVSGVLPARDILLAAALARLVAGPRRRG
ncbi:MAG: NAD(P)/FAD-dependent oxidoreductase [Armatimonadota bacterium]|nr:NAD(P)/FAD-dependent oxidoreductase [Armatimonadota bacterium]